MCFLGIYGSVDFYRKPTLGELLRRDHLQAIDYKLIHEKIKGAKLHITPWAYRVITVPGERTYYYFYEITNQLLKIEREYFRGEESPKRMATFDDRKHMIEVWKHMRRIRAETYLSRRYPLYFFESLAIGALIFALVDYLTCNLPFRDTPAACYREWSASHFFGYTKQQLKEAGNRINTEDLGGKDDYVERSV